MGNQMGHICGSFDNGTNKCCKYCKHFMLWGVSAGACMKHDVDVLTWGDACEEFQPDNIDK